MEQPKNTKNDQGKTRKVGFELEYSNIDIKKSAELVQNLFGGDIKCINDSVYEVLDTELGDFKVELDAIPIQKISASNKKIQQKKSPTQIEKIQAELGHRIEKASTFMTPFEIVTPPISLDNLQAVSKLEKSMKENHAEGTRSSLQYAFGLHINPEVSSLKVASIVRHLQAFLLIEPWLKEKHDIDMSRKLTNFIDPFPKAYLKHVLQKDYQPSMDEFIEDYHHWNPSRNRSLDLTPLLCFIDEDKVRDLYGKDEKINKRPTFHYRLPNCDIGELEWSVEDEWRIWLTVENLAYDEKLLDELLKKWQEQEEKFFSMPFEWVKTVKEFIKEHEI